MSGEIKTQEDAPLAVDLKRRVMWRCDGCGALLKSEEVQEYGTGHCHTIAVEYGAGDWEPQPCGPVVPYEIKAT